MARRKKYILPRSLGAVVKEYQNSPEFAALKPATKLVYWRAMDRIAGPDGKGYIVKVEEIRRRHIIQLRDRWRHSPASANQIINMMSVLLKYARDMEYVEINVAAGVKQLAVGEIRRWTDEEVAYALDRFPDQYRRAVLLALYTGQRQGDIVKMTWTDYDGEGIQVTQQKTGMKLWIPCHEALRVELEDWRQDRAATTILVAHDGKPYRNGAIFSSSFSRFMKGHPALAGAVFHGLRKTAAAKLAEAGCTAHEIASITGHKSLAMLALYTAEAEQRTRAKAAVHKLELRGAKSLK